MSIQKGKASTRIEEIIHRLRNEFPEHDEQLIAIGREARSLQSRLRATPKTIGWDLLCFRVKQLMIQRVGIVPLLLTRFDRQWEATTETHEHDSGVLYNPPQAYSTMLGSPQAFDRLLNAYEILIEKSGSRFREDYLNTFFKVRGEIIPRLTQSQLKIFKYVLSNQTTSPTQIAQALEMTKGYVSRVIGELKDKYVISERVRFSYGALGLQTIIAIIEMDSLDVELPHAFTRKNPWLYSIFESRIQRHFAIAHFIVPLSWRSPSELGMWAKRIAEEEHVVSAQVWRRNERANWMNYNFDAFDGRTWNVPSGVYSPQIHSGFRAKPPPIEPQVAEPNLEGFFIDGLDIRIIHELVTRGPLTVRELRAILGKDYNVIQTKYYNLRERKIIVNRVHPSPLFAPGTVLAVAKLNDEYHRRLCNAVSCLPEVYTERTYEGYTVFTLRVPEKHTRDVITDLNDILEGHERWLTYHGDMHFFNWTFPMDRWMEGYREWYILENDFGAEN